MNRGCFGFGLKGERWGTTYFEEGCYNVYQIERKLHNLSFKSMQGSRVCSFSLSFYRFVLLPGQYRELQPGQRRAFQVHPGRLQDGPDQRGRAYLQGKQLLRSRKGQELP